MQIRKSAIREPLLAFLYDWLLFWVRDADNDKLLAVLDRADDDDGGDASGDTLRRDYNLGEQHSLLRAPEALDQPPLIFGGMAYAILKRGTAMGEARGPSLAEAQQPPPRGSLDQSPPGLHLAGAERPRKPSATFGQQWPAVPRAVRRRSCWAEHYTTPATRMGPSLPSGRPFHSLPIVAGRQRPGPGPGPEGRAAGGHVPSGAKGWKRLRRLTTSGTAMPSFSHSSTTTKRTAGPKSALLDRSERQHRPLGHGRTRRPWPACSGRLIRKELEPPACAHRPGHGNGTEVLSWHGVAAVRERTGDVSPGPTCKKPCRCCMSPRSSSPPSWSAVGVAMAQFRSGCIADARKTLAAAVRAYNWMESQADHPTVGQPCASPRGRGSHPAEPAGVPSWRVPSRWTTTSASRWWGPASPRAATMPRRDYTPRPSRPIPALADNLTTECPLPVNGRGTLLRASRVC